MDYERIAEEVGYSSYQHAYRSVKKAMERVRDPVAEDILWMELGRLDKLLSAHWNSALDGDTKATQTCLDIMKRRAALLGLDSLNVDITTRGGKLGGPMIYIPQMDELFPDNPTYEHPGDCQDRAPKLTGMAAKVLEVKDSWDDKGGDPS